MLLFSFFSLFPIICAFIYNEPRKNIAAFLGTTMISLTIFLFLQILAKPKDMKKNFYAKEGFVIVAITWILYSVIGALPFYFSGAIPNFIDSIFESTSGFTTTGASILTDIEAMPHSMLLWRSFSHFIGGLGVIIFAIAILPRSPHNIHIMKAEVPSPIFGKLMSSMKSTAIGLYKLYIGLTLLLIILLAASGIGIFDSINLAFSTAGTGGFAPKNLGVAAYFSNYVTIVLTVFMIIFSLNFNLLYILLAKRYFKVLKSEELIFFLSLIVISTLIIFSNLIYVDHHQQDSLVDILFSVASIISTTGFTNIDFTNWTMFSKIILLALMIAGGCAGGTSGGLKMPRIMFILKNARSYIQKCINPNKVSVITIENKSIENNLKFSNYIILYFLVFSIISLIISIQIEDFEEIFTLTVSTLNNVGPGFNTYGPMDNFSTVPQFSKFILSISMLLGRLEILPFIVLLAPQTWRRKRTR